LDRSQKKELVSSLNKDFNESDLLVVTQYSGLDVKKMEELRSKMREVGVKFKVTKNRLTKLALKGSSFENVDQLFKGPTAIAYSKNSIQAAKVAVEFSKNNNKLKIIGGSFEGELIDQNKVNFLASLPTLDELRSQLISLITTPASKIAMILQAPGGQIARVISAHAKQK